MRPPRTRLWLILMSMMALADASNWRCPEFNETALVCSCDFPHTLRCSGGPSSLNVIRKKLASAPEEETVSLLDCTFRNLTALPDAFLAGVSVHGLVITSGELGNVSRGAFEGLLHPLQALGLPNNRLAVVPTVALSVLDGLERLDLSHNSLVRLDSGAFRDLSNLTFLDLSDNRIARITADAFSGLDRLRVLNLRKNRFGNGIVPALSGLASVEEMDLSTNSLSGPLQKETLPVLPSLETLFLANNQFSSIRKDALTGASSLRSLSVSNNNIDVLEDHAFRGLSALLHLDLSNNRIVAISGESLAHLDQLTDLDLSHNFLRALTRDIIAPLPNLRVLHVDDNDISLVSSEWPTEGTNLERLTLSDNPLNCDCTMIDFVAWLGNTSRLTADDRNTAVCTTPPHLENALLAEVHPADLLCEDSDDAFPDSSVSAHVSGVQIVLRAFNFDGAVITLLWSIDTRVQAFTCDALFVYEETSTHEVLLNSTPLRCNSSQLVDPTALVVRLPLGNMRRYHRYRYCVVLLEDSKFSDEMQLILGCSEVIPLVASEKSVTQPPATVHTRIIALDANVSAGVLAVSVALRNHEISPGVKCHVTVTVFTSNTLLAQHVLNCSDPRMSVSGLPPGRYHVCATLGSYSAAETKLHCTVARVNNSTGTSGSVLIVCFVFAVAFALVGVYACARKALKRSRMRSTTHQCFLATGELDDDDHKQHSRYVKLQTTTNM